MGLYNYIFGSKIEEPQEKPVLIPKFKCSCNNKKLFLVSNKTSDAILGIYNDLEKAKNAGQTTSYYNCRITELTINNCSYFNNVVFEDK
jgi:hypothetical protein